MMPAAPTKTNAYLRTKVMTANAEELRLMLFDGAIRFAEMARNGLAQRNYELSFEGTTRCQAILIELINGLRPEHDPELCRRLSALYTFMYTRLIDANHERKPEIVAEVLKLLEFERETWLLLMQKLQEEQEPGAEAMESGGGRQSRPEASPAVGQFSVQG